MMSTELTKAEAKDLASKWGAKDFVIPDEILDAYEKGKQFGILRVADELRRKRYENLLSAMRISYEGIRLLQEKLKLDVQKAFLRQLVTDDECFHKTLIIINADKYLDKIAKKAYNVLIEKSKKYRKAKNISIEFVLMPDKKLNTDLLKGDGFIYHYVKEKPSRT